MTEDQKSGRDWLPKVEILLIIVLSFGFIVWAISKCSRNAKVQAEQEQLQAQIDSAAQMEESVQDTTSENTSSPKPDKAKVVRERVPILYVTIDQLNLRDTPNLKGEPIDRLNLFEEVEFAGEVTDYQDTINLGYKEVADRWVKIRNDKGKEGWVFGAGVDYVKRKQEGVME